MVGEAGVGKSTLTSLLINGSVQEGLNPGGILVSPALSKGTAYATVRLYISYLFLVFFLFFYFFLFSFLFSLFIFLFILFLFSLIVLFSLFSCFFFLSTLKQTHSNNEYIITDTMGFGFSDSESASIDAVTNLYDTLSKNRYVPLHIRNLSLWPF